MLVYIFLRYLYAVYAEVVYRITMTGDNRRVEQKMEKPKRNLICHTHKWIVSSSETSFFFNCLIFSSVTPPQTSRTESVPSTYRLGGDLVLVKEVILIVRKYLTPPYPSEITT